ncbi:MAG: calcium/sodium antiporter [Candidatus Brocadiae bacterium]|nr:calcium/sodium antiporter [Candidatus Brocadiia bacterium]
MLLSLSLVAAGFVLLTLGGDWLVGSSSALAARAGISRLVVGLTVVAFGTSAPELAVSISGAAAGKPDIAFGNVLGSNLFNTLAILGLSAAIAPLAISRRLFAFDLPVMIAASLALWGIAADGRVGRLEGLLLALGLAVYLAFQIRLSRGDPPPDPGEPPAPVRSLPRSLGMIVFSLAILVVGSQLLVRGASDLARAFGLSELIIGLTIVAVGTSLPEVAASVAATLRGHRDIAVGNIVGSNIFNIGSVLGLSAAVAPSGIAVAREALALDIPIMVGSAILCLPVFFTGRRVSRLEGWLFLASYGAYVAFLILDAQDHAALPVYRFLLTRVFLPLSGLAILASLLIAWRSGNAVTRAVSSPTPGGTTGAPPPA